MLLAPVAKTLRSGKAPPVIALFTMGDSTVVGGGAAYGWANAIDDYLPLPITNFAVSGASSKSYWDSDGPADAGTITRRGFVAIQFGHNDEKATDETRFTTPGEAPAFTGTFRTYLETIIAAARARGSAPALITPVGRMQWTDGVYAHSHITAAGDYPACVRAVAASAGIDCYDLTTRSETLFARLGKSVVQASFSIGDLAEDSTHFGEEGAKDVAGLVTDLIAAGSSDLAAYASGRPVAMTSDLWGQRYVGGSYVVSGTVAVAGAAVAVYLDAVKLGDATVVGNNWTFTWTPVVGQAGVHRLLAVTGEQESTRQVVNVVSLPESAAVIAFWDTDYGVAKSGANVLTFRASIGDYTLRHPAGIVAFDATAYDGQSCITFDRTAVSRMTCDELAAVFASDDPTIAIAMQWQITSASSGTYALSFGTAASTPYFSTHYQGTNWGVMQSGTASNSSFARGSAANIDVVSGSVAWSFWRNGVAGASQPVAGDAATKAALTQFTVGDLRRATESGAIGMRLRRLAVWNTGLDDDDATALQALWTENGHAL